MGFVYVISAGQDQQKIGRAKNVKSRLSSLQTGCPGVLKLAYAAETSLEWLAEQHVHKALADKRLRGEWFLVGVPEAIAAVDAAVSTAKETIRAAQEEEARAAAQRPAFPGSVDAEEAGRRRQENAALYRWLVMPRRNK